MAKIGFSFSPGWERDLGKLAEKRLETLGDLMVADAQRAVPILDGDLQRSIASSVQFEGYEPVLYVYAGGGMVDYALYVELGTRFMRAQPYLRPAVFRRW